MLPTYLTGCGHPICADDACEHAVIERPETGRFYITIGHAGFNSPANNGAGYASRAAALAAFRRYANRGKRAR